MLYLSFILQRKAFLQKDIFYVYLEHKKVTAMEIYFLRD